MRKSGAKSKGGGNIVQTKKRISCVRWWCMNFSVSTEKDSVVGWEKIVISMNSSFFTWVVEGEKREREWGKGAAHHGHDMLADWRGGVVASERRVHTRKSNKPASKEKRKKMQNGENEGAVRRGMTRTCDKVKRVAARTKRQTQARTQTKHWCIACCFFEPKIKKERQTKTQKQISTTR